MVFRHPFRRYQRLALSWLESTLGTGDDDRRYHVVSPPGSGKTILGLEMISRFDRPALVLAPTTAIQKQWREQARLFLDEHATIDALVGTNPVRLAPITVLTYQVLSTTDRPDDVLDDLARERWCQELVDASQATDAAAAARRLDLMRANNPDAFRRELARRHRRVKRELLARGDAEITRFLHPNARDLLDRIVAHDIGTVVLDECHHLLDHWAVVLRYLTSRLKAPRIVGLTATLPDPDTPEAHENYTTLLGDVDFEVPTPAVVKEGELAPYRDLVRFVAPTDREAAYLRDVQGELEIALTSLTDDPRFRAWLRSEVGGDDPDAWAGLLRTEPLWAVAAMRVLHALGEPVGERLVVPVEAEEEPTPHDRAEVAARYGLRELKVSPDPTDHTRLETLRQALQPFGFVLTERGLRQTRSPGDLVLAYSEAKQAACAAILEEEAFALGTRLRAVVVTDFERAGRRVARAGDALVEDAGSARHTFRTLIDHTPLRDLDPVLLTGRTVWVDADVADEVVAGFSERLAAIGANATCRAEPLRGERIVELRGEGPDWSSRTYVRLVTDAFEQGLTRCLVGTRGLLGEGWDALRLNTLVDLTSVTTAQSVQQLRGRSLRLDPSWPRKVAHNWEIVCVATDFDHGDRDLRRFTRRHGHFWGVVPISSGRALLQEAAAGADALIAGLAAAEAPVPPPRGEVVKGVAHVDPDLAWQLLSRPWKRIRYDRTNRRSDRAIGDRKESYDLWGIGEPYENADRWIARMHTPNLRVRTVHTISGTLRALVRAFRASLLGGALLTLLLAVQVVAELGDAGAGLRQALSAAGWVVLVGLVGTIAFNARSGWEIIRRIATEQPPEEIAEDVAHALLIGLREAGLVSPTLIPEHVRVAEQPDGTVEVLLQLAPAADAEVFTIALGQIFGPVGDPRYLILRDDRRLPQVGLRWLWRPLRRLVDAGRVDPSYHPVPDVLGTNRARADAFAAAWAEHVGGGELVYTRSEDGWRVLLDARAAERPTATTWAFQRWH